MKQKTNGVTHGKSTREGGVLPSRVELSESEREELARIDVVLSTLGTRVADLELQKLTLCAELEAMRKRKIERVRQIALSHGINPDSKTERWTLDSSKIPASFERVE